MSARSIPSPIRCSNTRPTPPQVARKTSILCLPVPRRTRTVPATGILLRRFHDKSSKRRSKNRWIYLWSDDNSITLMQDDQKSLMTPVLSTTFVEAGVYSFSVQAREHIDGLAEGDEGAPWSEPAETQHRNHEHRPRNAGKTATFFPWRSSNWKPIRRLSTGAIVLDGSLSATRSGGCHRPTGLSLGIRQRTDGKPIHRGRRPQRGGRLASNDLHSGA